VRTVSVGIVSCIGLSYLSHRAWAAPCGLSVGDGRVRGVSPAIPEQLGKGWREAVYPGARGGTRANRRSRALVAAVGACVATVCRE
jgi:hypothetical protein